MTQARILVLPACERGDGRFWRAAAARRAARMSTDCGRAVAALQSLGKRSSRSSRSMSSGGP